MNRQKHSFRGTGGNSNAAERGTVALKRPQAQKTVANGEGKARRRAESALFGLLLACEAACFLFESFCFSAEVMENALKISAGIDIILALAFVANFKPLPFLRLKAFAFSGFLIYAGYSLGVPVSAPAWLSILVALATFRSPKIVSASIIAAAFALAAISFAFNLS